MINFRHANDRCQAPYGRIFVGPLTLYFSYDTVIAANLGGELYHIHNDWGPTTGKHFNAMLNRAISIEVTETELHERINSALLEWALQHVKDRLHGKETSY